MKKSIILILVLAIFAPLLVSTHAAVKDEIELQYDNIRTIGVGFDIDEQSGCADCAGNVVSYYSVPVEVLLQLQIYKNGAWKTLMSWTATGTGHAYAQHNYTVESGYTYKLKVTGYICNDLGIPIESEEIERTIYYPAS